MGLVHWDLEGQGSFVWGRKNRKVFSLEKVNDFLTGIYKYLQVPPTAMGRSGPWLDGLEGPEW